MDVTATSSTPATTAADGAARTAGPDKLANKETFLQLLVAQIRHQDPLKPADGVQFLSQLAQFSELEQLMAIRSELGALTASAQPSAEPQAGTSTAA
jgi:flagellar basal-body rod modification protein FlgD